MVVGEGNGCTFGRISHPVRGGTAEKGGSTFGKEEGGMEMSFGLRDDEKHSE